MEEKKLVNKTDIMELYEVSEYQAKKLIRQAKVLLVLNEYTAYSNRRAGRVPHTVIKFLLGIDCKIDMTIK